MPDKGEGQGIAAPGRKPGGHGDLTGARK